MLLLLNRTPANIGPLPTFADVERAARQIAGVAHKTPVVTSRSVNERTGADVFFKCENLQRAGAFKFRGAYNALSRLSPDERRRGVVAFSSGNHAQAVALAGQLLDIPRVIVMPADAPAVKRAAAQAYGAEIVPYDRERDDREAIGRRLSQERGLALIPPYDHPDVIAGQGTAARELFEEAGRLDVLLVPCGGGGLLAGSALAAEGHVAGLRRRRRRTRSGRRCDEILSNETTADGEEPSDRRGRRADGVARVPDFPARAAARRRHDDGERPRAAGGDVLPVGTAQARRRTDGRARRGGRVRGQRGGCGAPRRRHPDGWKRRFVAGRELACQTSG